MPTDKFDRLFADGSRAVLADAVHRETPPVEDGPRWGMSVVLRPDRLTASPLAALAEDGIELAGVRHWPTGAEASSHFTVRSLERHRHEVSADDPAVARYRRALRK